MLQSKSMRGSMKGRRGGLEKKKMVLIAEVSYQGGIQLSYCMDGITAGLRRNIWRS